MRESWAGKCFDSETSSFVQVQGYSAHFIVSHLGPERSIVRP